MGGSNYPAVALPYLDVSYLSSLFFVVYLTLGQVFLMRLLITAAYGAYREELFKRIQTRENRTHAAFSTAFEMLTTGKCRDGVESSGGDGADGVGGGKTMRKGMRLHQWLRLVLQVRPKFQKEVARAIFIAALVRTRMRRA